jgi:hypothetical protein
MTKTSPRHASLAGGLRSLKFVKWVNRGPETGYRGGLKQGNGEVPWIEGTVHWGTESSLRSHTGHLRKCMIFKAAPSLKQGRAILFASRADFGRVFGSPFWTCICPSFLVDLRSLLADFLSVVFRRIFGALCLRMPFDLNSAPALLKCDLTSF